jgi:hypothetical protein
MSLPLRLPKLSYRQLLLLDGTGALLSAGLLLVLARLEPVFGLPAALLYGLLPVALGLAAYSLGCAVLVRGPRPGHLRLIAGANLAYCVLSLALVAAAWPRITVLGLLFIGGELLIILALATAELRASRTPAALRPGSPVADDN